MYWCARRVYKAARRTDNQIILTLNLGDYAARQKANNKELKKSGEYAVKQKAKVVN